MVLRDELVTLAHGAGGKATRDLVEALFLEELGNDALAVLGDAAVAAGSGAARADDGLATSSARSSSRAATSASSP